MMTSEDLVYADTANLFGSDPESPEEHDILHRMHDAADASHRLLEQYYAQMHLYASQVAAG